MKKAVLSALLFIGIHCCAQNCDCSSTFQKIRYHVENNYAGWFDKISQLGGPGLEKLVRQIEQNAGAATSASACFQLLKPYVDYFKDGHLRLSYRDAQPGKVQPVEPPPPAVVVSPLTQAAITQYFNTQKSPDKAEGIWENDTYKIGIVRSKTVAGQYEGIILASKNSNWKPGEIKMYLSRNAKGAYNARFISGDKSAATETAVKFVKNILDAAPLFLSKTFPQVQNAVSLSDYEMENDPTGPRLTFPRKDLAVWVFPNFYTDNAQVVKYLLRKNKAQLAAASYWIIDLRSNEGGNVQVGNLLLPYLYTKPVIYYNTKVRLTKDNYDNWYETYVKDSYESFDSNQKNEFDSVMNITKSHYGEFRNIYNDDKAADTLVFEKPAAVPQKTALLINGDTYSSGELFTFLARQSDKVFVMGQPSAGTIDYDNVLRYPLPCSNMSLTLPMGRYNWLDEGISVDRDKIKPDILIPLKTKDWIVFSYRQLKTAGR
jgi:hypothetical protein